MHSCPTTPGAPAPERTQIKAGAEMMTCTCSYGVAECCSLLSASRRSRLETPTVLQAPALIGRRRAHDTRHSPAAPNQVTVSCKSTNVPALGNFTSHHCLLQFTSMLQNSRSACRDSATAGIHACCPSSATVLRSSVHATDFRYVC
jgi:hypothetical protein